MIVVYEEKTGNIAIKKKYFAEICTMIKESPYNARKLIDKTMPKMYEYFKNEKLDLSKYETIDLYKSGVLLIAYLDINFDVLLHVLSDLSALEYPETNKKLEKYKLRLAGFFKKLEHPYLSEYLDKYRSETTGLTYYADSYIQCKKLLLNNDKWFKEERNINLLKKLHYLEGGIILTYDNADHKGACQNLVNELPERASQIFKNMKKELEGYADYKKKIDEILKFCYTDEKSIHFDKLDPLRKYSLYKELIDSSFKDLKLDMVRSIQEDYEDSIEVKIVSPDDLEAIDKEAKLLLLQEQKLIKAYNMDYKTALQFELENLLYQGIPFHICQYCYKWFIAKHGNNTKYCDLIGYNGKTCGENAPTEKKKERADPIMEAYNKAYRRNTSNVRYKKLTKEENKKWRIEAREMRSKAYDNEITVEEFNSWLGNKQQ